MKTSTVRLWDACSTAIRNAQCQAVVLLVNLGVALGSRLKRLLLWFLGTDMPLQFTIDAGPNTEWAVRVFVHNSYKRLVQAHPNKDTNCIAFCYRYKRAKAMEEKDRVFCELHFSKGENMRVKYVVHECYHALIALARLTNLRVVSADDSGEEFAAESIEYMVDTILCFLKKKHVRVT